MRLAFMSTTFPTCSNAFFKTKFYNFPVGVSVPVDLMPKAVKCKHVQHKLEC